MSEKRKTLFLCLENSLVEWLLCSRVPHRQVSNIRQQSPISTQIREIDEKSINSAQESANAALEWLLESELPALFVPVVGDALAEAVEGEAVGDAAI